MPGHGKGVMRCDVPCVEVAEKAEDSREADKGCHLAGLRRELYFNRDLSLHA